MATIYIKKQPKNIWRMRLNPFQKPHGQDQFDYCHGKKFVGICWHDKKLLESARSGLRVFAEMAPAVHDYFKCGMQENDLVWVWGREQNAADPKLDVFYLAQIVGDYTHCDPNTNGGFNRTRSCRFYEVPHGYADPYNSGRNMLSESLHKIFDQSIQHTVQPFDASDDVRDTLKVWNCVRKS